MTDIKSKSTASQTRGEVSARIDFSEPTLPSFEFISDSNKVKMYRLDGKINVLAGDLGEVIPEVGRSFNFKFPDMPADGQERSYAIPGEVAGYYTNVRNGGWIPYTFNGGRVVVKLSEQDEFTGTFELTADRSPTDTVEVSNGKISLQGFLTETQNSRSAPTNTGSFDGEVDGGPFDGMVLNASEVEIRYEPAGPVAAPTWLIIGKQVGTFPFFTTMIVIFLEDGAGNSPFDLKDNPKVTVHFFNEEENYGAVSKSGTLFIDSLPDTGHAIGHFEAELQMNEDPPFFIRAKFDIKA